MTEELKPGWKLVAVNEGFDVLMQSLERAHRKGYMPDAITEEYEGFDYALAAPPASTGVVPAGWRLVPVEPTSNMIDAGIMNSNEWARGSTDFGACFRAMIAAAPTHDAARLAQTSREIEGGEG
jgi:hypothetical protein